MWSHNQFSIRRQSITRASLAACRLCRSDLGSRIRSSPFLCGIGFAQGCRFLFGTGAGLLGQYQAGQVGALSPFTSYLGGVSSLESLGMQPFELGVNLGGRNVNTSGANALLQGGLGAAQAMQQANAYSPIGSALTGLGSTMQQQQYMNRLFPTAPAPIEERQFRPITAAPAIPATSSSSSPWSGGFYAY